mmetsp:Transcript_17043/g.46729  ORF Transcript_17043/g.46729 Transcript_17043/m.46729 type:complete len:692 (+) Transcript_17043:60-2135(+)
MLFCFLLLPEIGCWLLVSMRTSQRAQRASFSSLPFLKIGNPSDEVEVVDNDLAEQKKAKALKFLVKIHPFTTLHLPCQYAAQGHCSPPLKRRGKRCTVAPFMSHSQKPSGEEDDRHLELNESPALPPDYTPSAFDVCCGRGKKNWNHQGNMNYRQLIRSTVEAYQCAGKRERTKIIHSIMQTIRQQGGRFVKQDADSGRWIDIGFASALEKVDHSLRDQAAPQEPIEMLSGPVGLPNGYQPQNVDVCCGRGKKNWNHQGNVWFRELIRSKVKQYQDAGDKHEKTSLIVSVVEAVRQRGGRFVKQDGNTKLWYDIGEAQSRDKVDHSLRDQVYHGSSSSEAKPPARRRRAPPSASGDTSNQVEGSTSGNGPVAASRKRPRAAEAATTATPSVAAAAGRNTAGLSAVATNRSAVSTTAATANPLTGTTAQQAMGISPGIQIVAPPFQAPTSVQSGLTVPLATANNMFGGLDGRILPLLSSESSRTTTAAGGWFPPQQQQSTGRVGLPRSVAAGPASYGGNITSGEVLLSPSSSSATMNDELLLSARRGELSTPADDDIPVASDELFSSDDSPDAVHGHAAAAAQNLPAQQQQMMMAMMMDQFRSVGGQQMPPPACSNVDPWREMAPALMGQRLQPSLQLVQHPKATESSQHLPSSSWFLSSQLQQQQAPSRGSDQYQAGEEEVDDDGKPRALR